MEQRWFTEPGGIETEIQEDGFEQLPRLEHRVHDSRNRGPPIQSPQEGLEHRRLARADLARDDDEAGVPFDAVAQIAERLLVHLARIEVVRIRAQCEGTLTKVKVFFVHGSLRQSWRWAGRWPQCRWPQCRWPQFR